MKLLALLVAILLGACLVNQAAGMSPSVDSLITTMQNSFGSLISQRDLWFENYSKLKNLTETDSSLLQELLFASKMVLPYIWFVYKGRVKAQKKVVPLLMEDEKPTLPYHVTVPASIFPFFYLEVTLLLHQEEDFQLKISNNFKQIFHLNFAFEERRVVLSNTDNEEEVTERVVLEGENFPAIKLHVPFRVNVQVADDCVFASIWTENLSLDNLMPLPVKHHWCTKDYRVVENISLSVNHESVSSHTTESRESAEDTQDAQENNHDIQLVSAIIYGGLIFQ